MYAAPVPLRMQWSLWGIIDACRDENLCFGPTINPSEWGGVNNDYIGHMRIGKELFEPTSRHFPL